MYMINLVSCNLDPQNIVVAVEDEKIETKTVISPADKVMGVPVTPVNGATAQAMGTVVSPVVATTLELRNPGINVKGNSAAVSPPNAAVSTEAWLQVQVKTCY